MLRASVVVIISMASAAVTGFGQSSSAQATFEVADVHVSPRGTIPAMRTVLRGGRYELLGATMVDLIRTAHGIDAENVVGGPSWVEFDRFGVTAKATTDTAAETLKAMLQSLLADRFKLVTRNETRPMSSYVLSAGKSKHKLKEAEPSGKTGCEIQPAAMRIVEGRVIAQTNLSCRNITMQAFAADLRRLAAGYFTTAVIDSTELKGAWDFDLKFTPKSMAMLVAGDHVSVFEAVDKQLGLTLEEKNVPRAVVVIDQVNRKPSENQPEIEKKLPPLPPAEFEVGAIKPVDTSTFRMPAGAFGTQPGGRVSLPPLSLRSLISLAWGPIVVSDEIVGSPKWIDSARFEVVAKVPAEYASASPGGSLQDIGPMLQALIIEQFKMKVRFEEWPVPAYTMRVTKPKLKKADPSARTGCKSTTSGGMISLTGSVPLPTTQITCQNMTMAQFAEQLQFIGSSYVRRPVVEATGLEGGWDFSFGFTAINPAQLTNLRLALPAGVGATTDAAGASDPVGGTTLFDAIEKQLGLKLEQQKRSYPVLVIDHIEPLEGQTNGPDLPILIR